MLSYTEQWIKHWLLIHNKQIFHAFLLNIRNYSPEVINIPRGEVELNITLPRVNNFDTKQKKTWNICFITCRQHQTRSADIKADKTQQIWSKRKYFLLKLAAAYLTTTPCKSFLYCFCRYFFLKSLTHEKINRIWIFLTWNSQLIWDWNEITLENAIHVYDVLIITWLGCNNFQLFNLGKKN